MPQLLVVDCKPSMTPTFELITLAGVDERTPLSSIEAMLAEFSCFEPAILLSASPRGRLRYPRLEWIDEATLQFGKRASLHICGPGARDSLLRGELSHLLSRVSRVQVNGSVSTQEAKLFTTLVPQLILQFSAANWHLAAAWDLDASMLVDASGSLNQPPHVWTTPVTTKRVGYAGGLGPRNLTTHLPRIAAVAVGASWIHLENHLRLDDSLDLGLARRALESFEDFRQLELAAA